MPFQFRKEAIEEDLNSNFPSQGQGNPPLYYSLSEVVVPTYSINQAAEGSTLPQNLQTAWDYSTGHNSKSGAGTDTLISNTGFWLIDFEILIFPASGSTRDAAIRINDGIASKVIWRNSLSPSGTTTAILSQSDVFVVFLRSGDSLEINQTGGVESEVSYRQIATLNGTLVNPLGYSAA